MIKINLETFKKSWQKEFQQERYFLQSILNPMEIQIEHIGSTSLSDGIAKPIIDILIGTNDEVAIEHATEILMKNGYIYYEIYKTIYPERSHLVKVDKSIKVHKITHIEDDIIDEIGVKRKFHLHITKYKSDFWKRHIAFRDFLQENYIIRQSYFNLKKELAERNWLNMQEYAEAKTPFIRNIEKKLLNLLNEK